MSWAARLRSWREPRGILRFVAENFGVTLDPWQEEALLLFESPRDEDRRICLKACAGPGKSALLAWAAWYFLGTKGRKGRHPKAAAVAITRDNLRDNLWAELAKWRGYSPYLLSQFEWTSSRVASVDHPETWFMSARSWPKSASADEQGKTLAGLHSEYVLAVVDESGAVPSTVLRAAEQALSRCEFGKIIQAGNPISLEGMLYEAAVRLRDQWRVLSITGDPAVPTAWVNTPRLGDGPRKWAQQQIDTYGRDNPWVKAYVLGEFPPASINQLLALEDVEAAQARHLRADVYSWAQKRLGVDVARFGDDRSVIFPRQGLAAFRPVVMRNARTTAIAARVARAITTWGAELSLVDDSGHWGHGVIDNLLTGGYRVVPVLFEDKALDSRYKNRRAEMWVSMSEWVKGGGALPPIAEMVAELTTPTYTFLNGQFLIEPKDQIKVRLGRSPDLADALALTFALPEMPGEMRDLTGLPGERAGRGKAVRDRDPME